MKVDYTIEDIDIIAKKIVSSLDSKTLFIYGNMGVGKTTLIKAITKCLGSYDEVNSPTFSIVNEYKTDQNTIYHFDLYRIKDLEEAYNFGIEDYLYTDNWVIVEWPELIEPIAPKRFDRIDIVLNTDNSRTLTLNLKSELT